MKIISSIHFSVSIVISRNIIIFVFLWIVINYSFLHILSWFILGGWFFNIINIELWLSIVLILCIMSYFNCLFVVCVNCMDINPIDMCNTISLLLVDDRPPRMKSSVIWHYQTTLFLQQYRHGWTLHSPWNRS